jgi:hypothetical protein
MSKDPIKRTGNLAEVERIDEQLGVSDLPATAATHETPKLLHGGPSSPLRLLLERPEASEVAVRFNYLFH